MRDDELLILLGLGGLLLMSKGPEWGAGWRWPVPIINIAGVEYMPVVSQEFKPGRHVGVDIMYRRRSLTDRPEFPAGVKGADGFANGTTMHFAPPGAGIVAARDARVWFVGKVATGWSVVLDHGAPWATFYAHLQTVDLPLHAMGKRSDGGAPMLVKAGDALGTMGGNPNTDPKRGAVDSARLRHLHFETWYKGAGNNAAVDPQSEMEARWLRG
jgi:murein DD-endopeptidase MepM/ murein hydrolase activator NlpD